MTASDGGTDDTANLRRAGDLVADSPLDEELRALRAVTDSALGRLDVDELLNELLARIREILGADTAAVLMLDAASRNLVARAACGLEDEVHQAVHIPVGHGFAGRVAASRQPIVLNRVDATTVVNPILIEKGMRRMLGVPLLSTTGVIGVLHVGRLDERPFDDADAELLQVVAERVVGAVEGRRLAVEHAAAHMLERSLLPVELPVCPGLEFATRYVTPDSRTVGGDWFDLFTMPSGELWIVVGDVAGHGLDAAVVMGRIRSTLRSYAFLGREPDAVVELTNRKIMHFEPGVFATVVCAVSQPPYDTLRVTLAGHPPPVLATAGSAVFPDLTVDPPLGADPIRPRSATDVALPEGAAVVLYTDGLIERRRQSIDVGLEQLRRVVKPDEPAVICRDVLHALVGGSAPTDDVAIVALRRTATPI